jgi:NhaA family Na+:H+ antiporter
MNHRHATVHTNHYHVNGHRAHRRSMAHHRAAAQLTRTLHYAFDRSLLFPIGAILALVWANTVPESYYTFVQPLRFFVNEIAMAFFFALLGQEVLEAVMPHGALHSWRRWSLPVVAAAGGIVGAIATYLTYVRLQYEYPLMAGWPIACAVDIAATYYVVRMIAPRSVMIPFALVVAIASDVVGLFLVAPGYDVVQTRAGGVGIMLIALGLATTFRLRRVRAFWPYLFICGPLSWAAFYWEGLHPAFALLPLVPFLSHEPRSLDLVADQPDDDAVHHAEHEWHLLIQPVLFLFALVNAGVQLKQYDTGTWAMLVAQLVGRPIGMLAIIGVAVLAGLHLPRRLGWRELVVIALAASSGFTVALFFATGTLAPGPMLAQIKVGVLGSASGALLAVAAGWALKVGRFAR